ncbi:MAG: TraR/DksA C4-type zinc finger protein [Acidobacteria bacterium]|nr:TraR/DksA C4-type zinc finger protein [Acidobacteriota bacterium]
METLEEYLERAEQAHGHMCAGQVLGVRMAMLGCQQIGITDPRHSERKNILVFVEIDRCAADAINTVTGCRLGKRTLKYHDYGKLAATFLNLQTDAAVRVVALDSSREAADIAFSEIENKYQRQLQAYKVLPDEKLFKIERVKVNVPAQDQPGRPVSRVICEGCGEGINDQREVIKDQRLLCRACAGDAYYTKL